MGAGSGDPRGPSTALLPSTISRGRNRQELLPCAAERRVPHMRSLGLIYTGGLRTEIGVPLKGRSLDLAGKRPPALHSANESRRPGQ